MAQWRNRGVFGCSVAGGLQGWGAPGKNDHKNASTLGKLVPASVTEGQKICNGLPPKVGIGKIVKFGPLFCRHGCETILRILFINLFFKKYGSKIFLFFPEKNRAPLKNFTGGPQEVPLRH